MRVEKTKWWIGELLTDGASELIFLLCCSAAKPCKAALPDWLCHGFQRGRHKGRNPPLDTLRLYASLVWEENLQNVARLDLQPGGSAKFADCSQLVLDEVLWPHDFHCLASVAPLRLCV